MSNASSLLSPKMELTNEQFQEFLFLFRNMYTKVQDDLIENLKKLRDNTKEQEVEKAQMEALQQILTDLSNERQALELRIEQSKDLDLFSSDQLTQDSLALSRIVRQIHEEANKLKLALTRQSERNVLRTKILDNVMITQGKSSALNSVHNLLIRYNMIEQPSANKRKLETLIAGDVMSNLANLRSRISFNDSAISADASPPLKRPRNLSFEDSPQDSVSIENGDLSGHDGDHHADVEEGQNDGEDDDLDFSSEDMEDGHEDYRGRSREKGSDRKRRFSDCYDRSNLSGSNGDGNKEGYVFQENHSRYKKPTFARKPFRGRGGKPSSIKARLSLRSSNHPYSSAASDSGNHEERRDFDRLSLHSASSSQNERYEGEVIKVLPHYAFARPLSRIYNVRTDKNIYLSKSQMTPGIWRNLRVGDRIDFVPKLDKKHENFVALNIRFIGKPKAMEKF